MIAFTLFYYYAIWYHVPRLRLLHEVVSIQGWAHITDVGSSPLILPSHDENKWARPRFKSMTLHQTCQWEHAHSVSLFAHFLCNLVKPICCKVRQNLCFRIAQLSKWHIRELVYGLWSIQLLQTNKSLWKDSGRTYIQCILYTESFKKNVNGTQKQCLNISWPKKCLSYGSKQSK